MAASDFAAYAKAVNQASLLAQRDLSGLWDRLEGRDPSFARDALLELVPGIIWKYGDMAALAAAEYYEAERIQAGGAPGFVAELSAGVSQEQIAASVRYACGHLFPTEGENGIQPEPDASLFGGQGR